MADIPTTSFTGTVDANTIYTESLFNPTANSNSVTEVTFEILNGGLTSDNFAGADGSLQAHQIEMGAFAQGYYFGFDRTDFIYAEQLNLETETVSNTLRSKQRLVHSSLTCNVFLPWNTKCVMYGYQAMFAHDSSQFDASTTSGSGTITADEFYDLELQIGNNLDPNAASATASNPAFYLYQKLGHNRYANENDGTVLDSDSFSPIASEESFRYVSKTGMLQGAQAPTRGYLQVRVTVGCRVLNQDAKKSKIKTPSGSIWLIALR